MVWIRYCGWSVLKLKRGFKIHAEVTLLLAKVLPSTDLYLHGEQEVLHDDAVEVKEADDASHPEVAGLGP